MPEVLTLTTAIVPPSRTTYQVQRVTLDWAAAAIRIDLLGSDGVVVSPGYDGAAATALMVSLNKVDLSVKSLHRRIIEKLVTDGLLPAGSVTGAPQ